MQQHHGAPVRLRGSNIHIGHPHLFAVVHQRQQVDGVGIGKTFEADAVGLACGCVRAASAQERAAQRSGEKQTMIARRIVRLHLFGMPAY